MTIQPTVPRIDDETLCIIASNLTTAFYAARGGNRMPTEQNIAQTYQLFIGELKTIHRQPGTSTVAPEVSDDGTGPMSLWDNN